MLCFTGAPWLVTTRRSCDFRCSVEIYKKRKKKEWGAPYYERQLQRPSTFLSYECLKYVASQENPGGVSVGNEISNHLACSSNRVRWALDLSSPGLEKVSSERCNVRFGKRQLRPWGDKASRDIMKGGKVRWHARMRSNS